MNLSRIVYVPGAGRANERARVRTVGTYVRARTALAAQEPGCKQASATPRPSLATSAARRRTGPAGRPRAEPSALASSGQATRARGWRRVAGRAIGHAEVFRWPKRQDIISSGYGKEDNSGQFSA